MRENYVHFPVDEMQTIAFILFATLRGKVFLGGIINYVRDMIDLAAEIFIRSSTV